MSSIKGSRHQEQKKLAPKRLPQSNVRNVRLQGTATRAPLEESNADTLFVPVRKPPPPKKIRVDLGKPNPEFVTIFPGPSATQTFKVHLDAIITFSPYFKTAFTNYDYEEARTKTMKLRDVDEKVFRIFNNWLYNQDCLRTEDAIDLDLLEVAKLWTAGGKWKIPALQNQCIILLNRMLIRDLKTPTQDKDVALHQFLAHAYSTKEETQLKKLAVQKMILVLPTVVSLKEWAADFTDSLMVDISEALMKHHQSLPANYKTPKFTIKNHLVPEPEYRLN